MNKEQKERLEQELRFLKESLEADVISKDEYERGRERIERKLKELELSEYILNEEPVHFAEKKEESMEEPAGNQDSFEAEKHEEPEIKITELKEQPTKIIGARKEEEIREEESKEEKKEEEPEEEEQEEKREEEKPVEAKEEPEKEIKFSKKWLYGIAILIIALILFFSIRGCNHSSFFGNTTGENPEEGAAELSPECSSDLDCRQEGMVGSCLNPDSKEAKCQFIQDVSSSLIVINDPGCKLCDSSTTENILRELFPAVSITEIDYRTAEAKKLISKFSIDALPAYIFDSNISKAINFDGFKSALIKRGNNYLMSNTASGAAYYFKRPLIKNKLDVYLSETNEKIYSSIKEVSGLFKDKVNITTQIVAEAQKEELEKELAINTYPSFLLNNQLKFRGILPANTLKERICEVNNLEECKKELSKI